MARLISSLAVSDTIVVILTPFNMLTFRRLLKVDIRSLNQLSCHGFFWLFRTGKMTSSLFVVLITIEVCAMTLASISPHLL